MALQQRAARAARTSADFIIVVGGAGHQPRGIAERADQAKSAMSVRTCARRVCKAPQGGGDTGFVSHIARRTARLNVI